MNPFLKVVDKDLPLLTIDVPATKAAVLARFRALTELVKHNSDISYSSLAALLNGNYRPISTMEVQGSAYQVLLHRLRDLGVLVEKERFDQAA